jgi:hypothetical protein
VLDDNPEPPPSQGSIWAGIRLTLLLHLIQIPFGLITIFIAPAVIGLSQLVYMIPAILRARKNKEPLTEQGLIIGASVTFLLNATCWGMAMFG